MQDLIAFLTKSTHWLLFILLEVVSVVLLFKYNGYQGSVWISSANSVAGQVYEWLSDVEQHFKLKKVNSTLASRNIALERELYQMRSALQELTDSATIAFMADSAMQQVTTIDAKVVRAAIDGPNNLVTINRGSEDGVKADMGVVSGQGVVGVVYMTGAHYSVVLPVLNSRSRISCAIRNKNYFGYLTWAGGDSRHAYVEGVPRHARFELNEMVETNGFSAIFPPGITVGRIVSKDNSRDGLSYRLKVELATDFSQLRDVCVITDKGFEERRLLEQAVGDSLKKVK